MSHFRAFEVEALKLLAEPELGREFVDTLIREAELVSLDFSGCGYFLTVRHPSIPAKRTVFYEPRVVGRVGNIQGDFIVFVEEGELMLEYASVGASDVNDDFRNLEIHVTAT
jgi:hypothetical protein